MAVAEIQISETETPLHRLETVCRRMIERLATASHQPSLPGLADRPQRPASDHIRPRGRVTPVVWSHPVAAAPSRLCLPEVDEAALAGLKFSAALPPTLAAATLATRLADLAGAEAALREPIRFQFD